MGCQTLRPSSAIRNQSLGLTCLCKGKKKKRGKLVKGIELQKIENTYS